MQKKKTFTKKKDFSRAIVCITVIDIFWYKARWLLTIGVGAMNVERVVTAWFPISSFSVYIHSHIASCSMGSFSAESAVTVVAY